MPTLKTFILLIGCSMIAIPTQANNPTFQTITNPILPIQLGPVKLTKLSHKFLFPIDISIIANHTDELFNTFYNFKTKYQDDTTPLINYTLTKLTTKLESLMPKKVAERGLVDGIGKISKYLFGTLTEDDKAEITNHLEILNNNEHKIESQVNLQLSVLKPLLKTFNETVSTLSNNQNKIALQIKEIQHDFSQLNMHHISQQILNCANSLLNLIDEIYIAISFSSLKAVYNPIITLNEISFMKDTISELYGNSHVLQLKDYLSYFKLMHQDVFFKYPNFNFIITVPLFSNENSYMYKLYPIPQGNLTLVPPKPFLILGESYQKYLDEECPLIETYYICNKDSQSVQGDCISSIVRGQQPAECHFTKVQINQPVIQPVSSSQILVLPVNDTVIRFECDTTGNERTASPTLITIDKNCKIYIDDKNILIPKETTVTGTGILLPPLPESTDLAIYSPHTLKLDPVHFEDITRIIESSRHMSAVQHVQALPNDYTFPLSTCIALVLIIGVLTATYLLCKRKICGKGKTPGLQKSLNNDIAV